MRPMQQPQKRKLTQDGTVNKPIAKIGQAGTLTRFVEPKSRRLPSGLATQSKCHSPLAKLANSRYDYDFYMAHPDGCDHQCSARRS